MSEFLEPWNVGVFGALECRNFWSLCVGQIGAPQLSVYAHSLVVPIQSLEANIQLRGFFEILITLDLSYIYEYLLREHANWQKSGVSNSIYPLTLPGQLKKPLTDSILSLIHI